MHILEYGMIHLRLVSYIILLLPNISRWADFIIRGTVSLSRSAVQNVSCTVNRLRLSQTLQNKRDCTLSTDVENRWTLFIWHRIIHEPIVVVRANFLWGIMMNRITVGTGTPINRALAVSFLFPPNYPSETCMLYQDKHSKISGYFNSFSIILWFFFLTLQTI